MSFIQDLVAPGARQAGDAAQSASEMQRLLAFKLMALQDKLAGFVKDADQKGMFDPERAAERFNADFNREHGQDMDKGRAVLAASGVKPGDSEYGYNLSKEHMALSEDRGRGMEQARQDMLAKKLQAYSATDPNLMVNAGSMFGNAGQLGIQAGQFRNQGAGATSGALGDLYTGLSKFLKRRRGGGGGWGGDMDDSQRWGSTA